MFIEMAIEMAQRQAQRLEDYIQTHDGETENNIATFYARPSESEIAFKINTNLMLAKDTNEIP